MSVVCEVVTIEFEEDTPRRLVFLELPRIGEWIEDEGRVVNVIHKAPPVGYHREPTVTVRVKSAESNADRT